MPHLSEPARTIYTEEWVLARNEVERLKGLGQTQPFGRAMDQLEAGWENVRALESWSEERELAPGLHDAEDAARWYVEVEVVDLFRWIAGETLQCIPRPDRALITASVEDLESEVEALRRNVRMLLLAVQAESVPTPLRRLAEEHAGPLVDWSVRFGEAVVSIRRYLDAAGIEEACR
jgi:hypothetical protein